jgi:hydroxymethylbilane synthase
MICPPVCRIGTRKSALATTQSTQIMNLIESQGIACRLVLIESKGDQDRTTPLYEIEAPSPGLFTKQLEIALQQNQIDVAVHSLKDLPTEQPSDLRVICQPPRVIVSDCLVTTAAAQMGTEAVPLKLGARIGTSSLRREAQLLALRPDLKIVPIRGNVPSRVRQVREGKVDAVVLAEAGLFRLGLDLGNLVRVPLSTEWFVPAPGQGALAVEVRSSVESGLEKVLISLNDSATEIETRIERRVLRLLEGGCTLPLGVRCQRLSGEVLKLNAFLGVLEQRGAKEHHWVSFHRFEFSHSEEDVVVENTVDFFKPKLI